MSAFSILPRNDPKQAHRVRRFFLASSFSLMYLFSLFVFHAFGRVQRGPLLQATVLVLAIIVAYYAIFRSGANRIFRDPSLTAEQLVTAVAAMLYIVALDRGSREVFCAFVYVAFMFGMLRLQTRHLILLAGGTLGAFGAVILLAPADVPDGGQTPSDVLAWLLLAVTMPWMILIGGYVRRLRSDLVSAHLRLEDIEEQARRDELTGVYNRRALMAVLLQEKRRADRFRQPFSLCVIDVDHFKAVNDSVGHLAGDEVLRRFATSVSETIRTTDTFGRYGGEEFLHVLTGTSLAGALQHADRVREIAMRLDLSDLAIVGGMTVSVGVAQYIEGESIVETLGRADGALYKAKRSGRNRACSDPDTAVAGMVAHADATG